jgi:hypothetical protein
MLDGNITSTDIQQSEWYLPSKGPYRPNAIRQREFSVFKNNKNRQRIKILQDMQIIWKTLKNIEVKCHWKGPHRPDAIRQRDANFEFSKTNKTVNG